MGAQAPGVDHAAVCSAPGGVPVTFQISPSGGGEVVVVNGTTAILNVTQSVVCTLAPGDYLVTAFPSSGYQFQQWQSSGEGIDVAEPSTNPTKIALSSSTGVSLTAAFSGQSATSSSPAWWLYAAIALAVVVVLGVGVALLLRRRGARSGGASSEGEVPPRPASSAPAARSEASAPPGRPPTPVPAESWTRYATSYLEGVLEEDLWPMVAGSSSPANLLCFTWGRAERLASRYNLAGAQVVRISRVETVSAGERVAPSDVDAMVDLVEKHFHKGPGRVVVIPDVHAIVNARDAKSVIRLLEIARDLALEKTGSVLFTLDPSTLSHADVALLERGAHKVTVAS
jgi:hypothetical protein